MADTADDSEDEPDSSRFRRLLVVGPATFLFIVLAGLAFYLTEPAPPSRLTIAAGERGGAYQQTAERYRAILSRHGVELTVRETAGSVENGMLLTSGDVDVAIVQGGCAGDASDDVVALASLHLEPLWVFHRVDGADTLADLAGKRVAIGPEGSGTRSLAELVLNENDLQIDASPLAGEDARAALRAGEVDAVMLVAAADAPLVAAMSREAALMSFPRAAAYARRHRFLSEVTLPRGVLDLADDRPADDVALIAPSANLHSQADLHPALVALLLEAAKETHGGGDILAEPKRFPSPELVDRPLHPQAVHYYRDGPPLLMRHLPYWAASLVDRLKFALLPLIALIIPLSRIVGPTYRWRIRSRIYRWYRQIQAVDRELRHGEVDAARCDELERELDELESDAAQTKVPLAFTGQLYDLRLHIDLVREHIARARENTERDSSPSA